MTTGKRLWAFLVIILLSGLPATIQAEPADPPGREMLRQRLWRLIDFGRENPVFPNIRQAGTKADDQATKWLETMFKEFGLDNVRREPVPITGWQPSKFGLTAHSAKGDVSLESWPIFYARFLDSGSITAEMKYIGASAKGDMSGKIVVADMLSPQSLKYDTIKAVAFETFDPEGSLKPGDGHQFWAFSNEEAYHDASKAGAAAFIGILRDKADNGRFFQNAWGIKADPTGDWGRPLGELPGHYVTRAVGEILRPLAETGISATLISAGSTPQTSTYNVIGVLPGLSEKIIQIQSHSDGGAVNDASGAIAVLTLAEYYSKTKISDRRKTLQFVITGGHFTIGAGLRTFIREHSKEIQDKVLVNLTIEHIGIHYDLIDGQLISSGLPCPKFLFTTKKTWLPILSEAVHKFDLRRTFIMPHVSPTMGEGASWRATTGLPSIYTISPVQYMQSSADTKEKIDLEGLGAIINAYIHIIDSLDDSLE